MVGWAQGIRTLIICNLHYTKKPLLKKVFAVSTKLNHIQHYNCNLYENKIINRNNQYFCLPNKFIHRAFHIKQRLTTIATRVSLQYMYVIYIKSTHTQSTVQSSVFPGIGAAALIFLGFFCKPCYAILPVHHHMALLIRKRVLFGKYSSTTNIA